MMKKYILILVSAALILFSCTDKNDNIVFDSIATSSDTLKFGSDGGTMGLKITSSGDWRLSGLCDWVTPSATEGKDGATITFTAKPSNSKSAQESLFKVFVGSAVKKIVVISTPAYVMDLKSEEEETVVCNGGSANVKLVTNVPDLEFEYSGDGADWISFSQRSDAFGMTKLQFNVKKSDLFKSRESVVTIKGEGKSVNVKFVQCQRDTIIVEGNRAVYDLASRDVELRMRTNIDYDVDLAAWMTYVGETVGAIGADGLTEKTLRVHLDEAAASRLFAVKISKGNTEYVRYIIKQQTPNPVLVNIPDAVLRMKLAELGWVLGDESSDECELIEQGLVGTSLNISSSGSFDTINIQDLTGLEAFPRLEELTLAGLTATSLDLSLVRTLKTLKANRVHHLAWLKVGENLKDVDFTGEYYDYFEVTQLSIAGPGVETIKANSSSYYISIGDEKLATINVTGCPALKTLQAKRECDMFGMIDCCLNTIYVTATQKAAIDAETLTVEKSDKTSIAVK
ncbi:MAG TPA: hypothetical protein DDX40_03080 [Rikenellaceae bacterium]|nr:hypothetical protein [Rikenellaceae bacterium]